MQVVTSETITPERHITHLALLQRFTLTERTSIRTSTDEVVQDIMFLFSNAKYIDLDRPDTIASLNALESKGVLASGRATEILAAPVLAIEIP